MPTFSLLGFLTESYPPRKKLMIVIKFVGKIRTVITIAVKQIRIDRNIFHKKFKNFIVLMLVPSLSLYILCGILAEQKNLQHNLC